MLCKYGVTFNENDELIHYHIKRLKEIETQPLTLLLDDLKTGSQSGQSWSYRKRQIEIPRVMTVKGTEMSMTSYKAGYYVC